MFSNYLKTALRYLWRMKGYTLINVFGLAIGMATCLLIFLYISHELSFDEFFSDSEDIYRVAITGHISEDQLDVAVSMGALGPKIMRDYPEVKHFTRIESFGTDFLMASEDRKFIEDMVYFVDSSFFSVFPFQVLQGDPNTALEAPNRVILTKSTAMKYFGAENPMGKILKMNDNYPLEVAGVMEDVPPNCHMKFDFLVSLATRMKDRGRDYYDNNWGSINLFTYLKLHDGTDRTLFQEKIKYMIRDAFGEDAAEMNMEFYPVLQPVRSIHLHSHLMAEIGPNGNISYVYTFSAIAIFILLIASINFMNLSTARATNRAREVGLRKVGGATRGQLMTQYLGESTILSLLALVLALIIAELVMPLFNQMTGFEANLASFGWQVFLVAIALTLFVGLVAGSYPAMVLSSFLPIQAIRGGFYKGRGRSRLRNVLVLIQFVVSIALLISTFLIYSQLRYMQNKKLGFDKENVIVIPLRGTRMMEKSHSLKAEFEKLSIATEVSISSSVPGKGMDGIGFVPEGIPENSPWIIYVMECDPEFIGVMGMDLIAGRNFSDDFGTDSMAVIINETLAKKLGWEDPIGKKIMGFGTMYPEEYHVIGMLADYHFKALHDAINPAMLIGQHVQRRSYLSIRTVPGDPARIIDELKQTWEQAEQAFPFDYFFLNDDFEDLYRSEMKMGRLFIYFTLLAIFVACLGLFGLSAFTAEQRTREIGIRKVMGATVQRIVFMMGREFTLWVLLANLVAWPVAFYLMDLWLQSFAYRIEVWAFAWVFLASGLIALAIALLTVSLQAYRAATTDPVKALKYE